MKTAHRLWVIRRCCSDPETCAKDYMPTSWGQLSDTNVLRSPNRANIDLWAVGGDGALFIGTASIYLVSESTTAICPPSGPAKSGWLHVSPVAGHDTGAGGTAAACAHVTHDFASRSMSKTAFGQCFSWKPCPIEEWYLGTSWAHSAVSFTRPKS